MFDLSETFWLNLTNYGLAVLCAICWIVIVGGIVKELVERRQRALATVIRFDDHAFHVNDLGMTMADGGEPVDGREPGAEPTSESSEPEKS